MPPDPVVPLSLSSSPPDDPACCRLWAFGDLARQVTAAPGRPALPQSGLTNSFQGRTAVRAKMRSGQLKQTRLLSDELSSLWCPPVDSNTCSPPKTVNRKTEKRQSLSYFCSFTNPTTFCKVEAGALVQVTVSRGFTARYSHDKVQKATNPPHVVVNTSPLGLTQRKVKYLLNKVPSALTKPIGSATVPANIC